jgi:ferritin-like metal-binding protein YciE
MDETSALKEFFIEALKDILWAEKNLCKALPQMAKKATSADLREALKNHLAETENHVVRLEQVFAGLDEQTASKKCDAMDGLIIEAENMMSETYNGTMTRDVGIIAAAQKIEHYEIASYGTLRTIAEVLGFTLAAHLLNQTLDEEKKADIQLTQIAKSHVNLSAMRENS